VRLPTRKRPATRRMISRTLLRQKRSSPAVKHRQGGRASRRRCDARGVWTLVVVFGVTARLFRCTKG